MITIPAKDIDIEIDASAWRIYEQSERLLPKLLVELLKGSNILEYHSDFGQPRGLPGNKLGIDYVRAIVAGYDPKGKCWRLGLHVSNRPEDDPRWVELAQWPPGPNQKFASEAQQAGRALAELVGCPLKVFGVKKLAESRPTGPLEDHQRKVINLNDVFRVVRDLKLPVTFEGVELAEGRGGNIVLRTSRQYDENQAGKITPGYRQCEIDSKKRVIRLIPPTGLLGSFLGGAQGREISFNAIRNVELRHRMESKSSATAGADGMLIERTLDQRLWEVYITLADESLLLAMSSHTKDSDLIRQRGEKRSTQEFKASVSYYRQLEQSNQQYDNAKNWAEATAYMLASVIKCPLVVTKVGLVD